MPKLNKTRQTVDYAMTTVEGGKITFYRSLTAGEVDRIVLGVPAGQERRVVPLITALVKEWNLEAEDGTALPVTEENVGCLDAREITGITAALELGADFLQGAASPTPTPAA